MEPDRQTDRLTQRQKKYLNSLCLSKKRKTEVWRGETEREVQREMEMEMEREMSG